MRFLGWLRGPGPKDLPPVAPRRIVHAPTEPSHAISRGSASGDRRKEISNRFTYHPPTERQIKRYGSLRTRGKELAFLIDEICPDSPEKETALVRLDEVIMHANASIARHEGS